MSGILRLESLTKGNTLKQGDKTPLKYRLFDADGENLNIAGKSAKVRLVYPDFLTIGYEKEGLTVAQDDTVTFTIDSVIPSRIYHVEIIVDDKFVFPSRADESKFTVDKSSLGTDANIIEIVGKDVLIREVKSQVDTELQPLVTSLESAQQAETQRASAESSRASAEEQRKTDHANRSAELDGKADKFIIENIVTNGDFSDGTSGWHKAYQDDTFFEVTDGIATVRVNKQFGGPYQDMDALYRMPLSGEKYYFCANVVVEGGSSLVYLYMNDGRGQTPASGPNTGFVSNIRTFLDNPTALRIKLQDDRARNWTDSKISDVIVINLTETFGAGNEPTKEEMDDFIKVNGYFDGEYVIDNKEMLGFLQEKADKKQEDWITPTLINGWGHVSTGLKYRKDSIGNTHIIGRVRGGVAPQIFTLPTGYRPSFTFTTQIVSNWKSKNFYIHSDGSVMLTSAPDDDSAIWVAINVIFPAEV